jgi:short-subunit dehydrogenase
VTRRELGTPTAAKGHALVTGASSGIGADLARQLAEKGYPLLLVARRKERLEALAAELTRKHQVDVVVLAVDLAEPTAAERLLAEVTQRGLRLEVLVNNAGYGMQGKFLTMAMPDVERMVQLNVTTLTHLTQLAARAMVEAGHGYILNVASAAAFLPSPFVSAYAATKAYVFSFSEALRFELRGTGVSLTTLYPGITTTEFNEVAHAKTPAVMNLSVLSADTVARAGLRAMFARPRAIVPGLINKLNAFFCTVLPRGLIVHVTGKLLGHANGW